MPGRYAASIRLGVAVGAEKLVQAFNEDRRADGFDESDSREAGGGDFPRQTVR